MTDRKTSHPVPTLSRRTLAHGAAWAVPVVTVASAAPAIAASRVGMTHVTSYNWYSNNAPWCAANRDGLSIDTTSTGTGATFTDSRTTMVFTNVYCYFWFARNDLTFTAGTGNSGCWTAPAYDGTSAVNTAGVTMYRYRTNYTCPITAVNGTTTLQAYNFHTQCFNVNDATWDPMRWVRRQAYATVNGTWPLSVERDWYQIPLP